MRRGRTRRCRQQPRQQRKIRRRRSTDETISDPPDTALPEPPIRRTEPPDVSLETPEISNRPPSDSNEDTPINFADPPILIVGPLLSNSAFPPMPVSDDHTDAILNPPAISEPDVKCPRQRRRWRRHPTYAYIPPMSLSCRLSLSWP